MPVGAIAIVVTLLLHIRLALLINMVLALVAGVLYVFGFIVVATLGCTAGSVDLTEGMFRHLVVTGRSRLALYLAKQSGRKRVVAGANPA